MLISPRSGPRNTPDSPALHAVPPTMTDPNRRHWVALALIVVVAALLRIYHYDYGVGQQFTYDTSDKIAQARAVAQGKLEPKNWKQPYFLPYAGGAVLRAVSWFTEVDGAVAERALTLLMIALSLGSVFLTERLAYHAFSDRRISLLSAALLAVVPINVVGSRYIKEDMPVLFWSHLALLFLILLLQRGGRRYYVLSGLAIGWAIGSKFSAVLLLPLLGAVHLAHSWKAPRRMRQLLSLEAALAGLAVMVGFLCFNPYLLANPTELGQGFLFQAGYSAGKHHDGTRIEPWRHLWTFYFRYAIFPGVTAPVALAFLYALVRAIRCWRNAPTQAARWLIIGWVVLAYIVFEKATAKPFPFFARYVQPIVPSICVLAAWALVGLVDRASSTSAARLARPLALLATATAVAWPLTESALISHAMKQDTRLVARAWINENLPRGSKLALDDPQYSPRPDKRRFKTKVFGLVSKRIYDKSYERLRAEGFDYVILNTFRTERFRVSRDGSREAARAHDFYEDVRERARLVREFRPAFDVQSYGFHNPIISIYALK